MVLITCTNRNCHAVSQEFLKAQHTHQSFYFCFFVCHILYPSNFPNSSPRFRREPFEVFCNIWATILLRCPHHETRRNFKLKHHHTQIPNSVIVFACISTSQAVPTSQPQSTSTGMHEKIKTAHSELYYTTATFLQLETCRDRALAPHLRRLRYSHLHLWKCSCQTMTRAVHPSPPQRVSGKTGWIDISLFCNN